MAIVELNSLYHGSDYRIYRMSAIQRAEMREKCLSVAKSLYELYLPLMQELKSFFAKEEKNMYLNVYEKVCMFGAYLESSNMYSYESEGIYLTSLPHKASDYAHRAFAFGEVGLTAYRMIQGLKYINIDERRLSSNLQKAISEIEYFAKESAEPVVFAINKIDDAYLYNAFGRERGLVDFKMISLYQDFFYAHELILNDINMFRLK